jgi:hypothetical protein
MGPLLKHIADREEIEARKQKKEKENQTTPVVNPAEEPVAKTTASTPVANEPIAPGPSPAMADTSGGVPSGMSNIAPVTQQELDPDNTYSTRDELERVRKNAGITVE